MEFTLIRFYVRSLRRLTFLTFTMHARLRHFTKATLMKQVWGEKSSQESKNDDDDDEDDDEN